MSQKRALPIAFHPLGLALLALAGLAVVIWRFRAGDWTSSCILTAALWVTVWMTVQLILDYRNTEGWLVKMTTPPFGLTLSELLRFRWPFLICIVAGSPLGFSLVMALSLVYMVAYIPWQAPLYYRSRKLLEGLAGQAEDAETTKAEPNDAANGS